MDPTDQDQETDTFTALRNQGILLGQHEQTLRNLTENNQALVTQIAQLTAQVAMLTSHLSQSAQPAQATQPSPPTPPPLPPLPPQRESYAPDPEPFAGDLDKCRGFLLQCSLVFNQRPQTFPSDQSKVHYILGLLRGRALAWAEAVNSSQSVVNMSVEEFIAKMKLVFDHPDHCGNAAKRLLNLRQGSRSVADFSVEFRTLAADSKWNDEALRGVFVKGLNESLKDELASRDEPSDLDSLVSLAIRLDNRLRERHRERAGRSSQSGASRYSPPHPTRAGIHAPPVAQASPPHSEEEPMQLGRAHLSPAERLRRMSAGECLYCGRSGHFISNCPVRPKEWAHQ